MISPGGCFSAGKGYLATGDPCDWFDAASLTSLNLTQRTAPCGSCRGVRRATLSVIGVQQFYWAPEKIPTDLSQEIQISSDAFSRSSSSAILMRSLIFCLRKQPKIGALWAFKYASFPCR